MSQGRLIYTFTCEESGRFQCKGGATLAIASFASASHHNPPTITVHSPLPFWATLKRSRTLRSGAGFGCVPVVRVNLVNLGATGRRLDTIVRAEVALEGRLVTTMVIGVTTASYVI